jgi:hypothetical protein
MTTPTGIDRDAPVIAHHEIDINAPLDTVWNLRTDVDAWPAWNLEVTAAKLDGAFAPGNSFTWTSYDYSNIRQGALNTRRHRCRDAHPS